MGLDVHLYKYECVAAAKAFEAKQEAAHSQIWDETKGDDGDSYSLRCAAWDQENPTPPDAVRTRIRFDSAVHPDHMFKVGYLRSSYNPGGINNILRSRTGKDLYYVFFADRESREYVVAPDWPGSLKRAIEARDAFSRYLEEHGCYGVADVSFNMFSNPESLRGVDSKRALEIFHEERNRDRERVEKFGKSPLSSGSYSTASGEYHFEAPLEVVAFIHGEAPLSGFVSDISGDRRVRPTVYVVHKMDNGLAWYKEALSITVEMVEWVVAQPDASKYHLHWSA